MVETYTLQGSMQCSRSCVVPVKDLGKGNPVQADNSAEAGKHVSRQGEHWLVDGCEESPKDDHARWRQDVCKRSTEGLGRIRKKLGHGLKVANLQEEQGCSVSRIKCDGTAAAAAFATLHVCGYMVAMCKAGAALVKTCFAA